MKYALFSVLVLGLLLGCGGEAAKESTDSKPSSETVTNTAPSKETGEQVTKPDTPEPGEFVGKSGRTLLVTQSQFAKNDEGKYVVPEAGVMLLLTPKGKKWAVERIEDKESNVFHKAIQYGDKGILTIGANEAKLKLWTKKDGKWISETLWHPTFGGKHNRLRDFELADFNGDGADDLAIATHDQGVVAVVWYKDGKWEAQELDRKKDTFVHEIEVGDLDKDGKMEFYATPSEPNTASGHEQGGGVLRYAWTGEKFEKSQVVEYESRHIKEILVADVDRDGTQELYAVLEAQMGKNMNIEIPVEIYRYDYKDGEFVPSKVVQLQDRFCRFLTAGDVDGDGQTELIAAAFSSGVWVIKKNGDEYDATCIDKNSGGFEHAAYLADIDGNGKLELYVADDNGGVVRQYIYQDGEYVSKVVNKRLIPAQAMVWNITVADL